MQLWDNAYALRRIVLWLYAVVFCCIVGAFGVWLVNSSEFPVRHVRINGKVEHISAARLQQTATDHISGNIFRVDINTIQAAYEKLPWIKSAQVRRLWPDTVIVDLTEHEPIARWNHNFLIDADGDTFQVENAAVSLPELTGQSGTEKSAAATYHTLAQILERHHLKAAALENSDRGAWTLTLDNGLKLILGRTQTRERLERLMLVWDEAIAPQVGQLEYIDLRYRDGFAVRSKGSTANTVTALTQVTAAPASAPANAPAAKPQSHSRRLAVPD